VKRVPLTFLIVSGFLLAAVPVTASGSTPIWKRLKAQHPRTEKYLEKTPDSQIRAGGARVYVKAPLDDTRATVTDFDHYDDMISRFEDAKIVGRHGNQTDVYLRLPILGGRSHLSTVVRFDPPQQVSKDEIIINGKMIKGDFRSFRVKYHLTQVDEEGTMLDLTLLMDPKVPRLLAPKGYVENEAASASDTAVRRLRDNSQKRAKNRG
jgi:ribosome-associated toxin RatA of RatAB toxin-antitoxin module